MKRKIDIFDFMLGVFVVCIFLIGWMLSGTFWPACARMMGGTQGALIGAGTTTTDYFTYDDGVLETVSSANWERWETNVNSGYLNVVSGKIKYGSGTAEAIYVEKTTYLSGSVYSQITLDTIAASMDLCLYINAQGQGDTIWDGYVLDIYDDAGTKTIEIYEILNAVWTLKTSDTTTSYVAGDVFRFENRSGALMAYKNGAIISGLTVSDATYAVARVGFIMTAGGAATRLDNWEGGDIR